MVFEVELENEAGCWGGAVVDWGGVIVVEVVKYCGFVGYVLDACVVLPFLISKVSNISKDEIASGSYEEGVRWYGEVASLTVSINSPFNAALAV